MAPTVPETATVANRHRGRIGSQSGFTLTELLVAMLLGVILLGGAVKVFTSAVQSEPRTTMRSSQVRDGRVMMDRITRELRQSGGVVSHSPNYLSVNTYVNTNCDGEAATAATLCRVVYECSDGKCTRSVRSLTGSGTTAAVTMVDGLASDNVFTVPVGPSPPFVGLRLSFADRNGHETVTLEDGVALRNVETA